jgi:hypothetical protein
MNLACTTNEHQTDVKPRLAKAGLALGYEDYNSPSFVPQGSHRSGEKGAEVAGWVGFPATEVLGAGVVSLFAKTSKTPG